MDNVAKKDENSQDGDKIIRECRVDGTAAGEVDEALSLLGSHGRWQVIYFVILSVGMEVIGAWHTYAYLFQAYTPGHHCKIPEGENLSDWIPWDNSKGVYSDCYIYVNISINNDTQKCSSTINAWDYFGDVTDTIVSEYNLVCDRQYLKKLTSTINGLGNLVGVLIFSPLIDFFGRRPVFLYSQWALVLAGVYNSFVYNYYVYLVVRFIIGFLKPGYGMSAFIMACELFPARRRTFAGIIIQDFWGVAMCFLALFMYLIPNWRYLQLLISLCGLFSVPLYWFLPESIPWLMTKGRVAEAEKTIQNAARINRIKDFPSPVFLKEEETKKTKTDEEKPIKNISRGCSDFCRNIFRKKSSTETEYTLFDIIRHNRLCLFLVVMSLLWFVNSTVYYGMTLNTEDLSGNRHMNLFLSGLVEIPAYTCSFFIINKWGRRFPLVIFHVFAGAFLIASAFVPDSTGSGATLIPLQVTLSTLGKFAITASYGIVYLYSPELYPTTVRSQANGVASLVSRIGGMIAPFTSTLNDIVPWLTSVVFGIVSIVGGLLALTLPETNKRPLPQTIDDIEHWYKTTVTNKRFQDGVPNQAYGAPGNRCLDDDNDLDTLETVTPSGSSVGSDEIVVTSPDKEADLLTSNTKELANDDNERTTL